MGSNEQRCPTCGNPWHNPDLGPYGENGLEDTHVWSYCMDHIHDVFYREMPRGQ